MYVLWSQDLSIGVAEIDGHHQALLGIVNELHDAVAAGGGQAVISDVLTSLADYAGYHFLHEETLMERVRYPYLEEHRRQHEDLIQRLSVLIFKLEAEDGRVTGETLDFLKGWVTLHILDHDRAIGVWIRDRQNAPAA